ncbi:MAG: ATP-binding protein [Bacteroidaceae bacterium]|nr:ATP-binding protein [Bacteroidaceae bacterium]MBR1789227.1 ATP-binding protein [Bacteroidaceae bacterium]
MKSFIDRDITNTIQEAGQYFPVICLTGPRQSGKSTLIKHLYADYRRFSLENLDVRSMAQKDPIAFLSQTTNGMVIDEVQQVPELMSYIQGIVDEHPERRFILSGSSNFLLMKKVSQSLAGRAGIFELLPMSMNETSDLPGSDSIDQLLYQGLYPAVCAEKNVPRFLYPSYVKTYLEKDVRELINVRDMAQFHTFLRLCAGRIGSVLNASELANETGVAVNTIIAWLSVLEASYIIFRLQPWSENTRKRLIKSPKLYFCDTGLACHLLDIENPEQLARDKMRGHLFENLIVMEALKHRLNQGKASNLFFYRNAKQEEIDLLLYEHGTLKGIEIKSAMTYNTSFEQTLQRAASLITTPLSKKAVVYTGNLENTNSDIQLLNYRHLHNFLQ